MKRRRKTTRSQQGPAEFVKTYTAQEVAEREAKAFLDGQTKGRDVQSQRLVEARRRSYLEGFADGKRNVRGVVAQTELLIDTFRIGIRMCEAVSAADLRTEESEIAKGLLKD